MLNDPIITNRTIFARNCSVKKIPRREADKFLDTNHIYGSASCRYSYGLFVRRATGAAEKKSVGAAIPVAEKESVAREKSVADRIEESIVEEPVRTEEMVAVACFSNARRWEKQGRSVCSYEWVRYASLKDSRVVGGMGKLLSAFIEDRHPDDVMTYAISTIAPGRPIRSGADGGDSDSAADPDDFGNAFRKLGFVEESRRTFPSRLVDGEMSVSIKFRLKLT